MCTNEEGAGQQRVPMLEWTLLPRKGTERSWARYSRPSPALQAAELESAAARASFLFFLGPLLLERAGGWRGTSREGNGWCFFMGLHSWQEPIENTRPASWSGRAANFGVLTPTAQPFLRSPAT